MENTTDHHNHDTPTAMEIDNPSSVDLGSCDYLVIGAGAASLAFVDTLLIEQPACRVIIVDKHAVPGGQWVDAYDFVHLHQPSVLYGVQSKQLEGWWPSLLLRGKLPWKHRASREEVLDYYARVCAGWPKDRVQFFFDCEYDFTREAEGDRIHRFAQLDGSQAFTVEVGVKLVNGVLGECKVPSQCPLPFPVSDVKVITPNDLVASGRREAKGTKFLVLGAGKTGSDAIVYLLDDLKISPDDVSWVVPNDMWMLAREKALGWTQFTQALLDADGDRAQALDALLADGIVVGLDPVHHRPTKLRLSIIGRDELTLARQVKDIVRRGRVTKIEGSVGAAEVSFDDDQPPLQMRSEVGVAVVHCASPGPFNDNTKVDIFASDTQLNLNQIIVPPVCCSSAMLAMLESARRAGTLDNEFARTLTGAPTVEGALSVLKAYTPGSGESDHDLLPIRQLAIWLALLDQDPKKGLAKLKANRLSLMSIPGTKLKIYENLADMVAKSAALRTTAEDAEMEKALLVKMEALRGC